MVCAHGQDRSGDVDALVSEHLAVVLVDRHAEPLTEEFGVLRVGLRGRDDLRARREMPRPRVLRPLPATSDYADAVGALRH